MDSATRELVRGRAGNRCEYCLLPQDGSSVAHHVEHIVARQHGGTDDAGNLALACHRCNLRKGPNLTGIDPFTEEISPSFNPRRDEWVNHFRLRGAVIEGITPVGRTTAHVLSMNDARRIELRELVLRRDRP
jgi:5-methylcytosine-specific restriction endonuclease McrA